ncbi:MAG: hypothetical protein D6814_08495 [Calditrichaeota bacterium]|nr:MAG: hypothetical protein D6814_08495 [Calditrichota bacterium]
MAITVVFQVPGMTAAQYDRVITDLEAKGLGAPDGRMFHLASSTADGWFVVDVFESQEKLGRFAEDLMPILAAAGVTPPEPVVYPLHNMIAGPGL